jgi:hypothetical protein
MAEMRGCMFRLMVAGIRFFFSSQHLFCFATPWELENFELSSLRLGSTMNTPELMCGALGRIAMYNF